MISVDGLTVEFGGSALFSDVSFVINEKDRIALMGKNGAGKSTLLKILAGVREPSRGKVSAPKDTVIAYLPQHLMTEDGRTVFEETAQAFAHLHEMEAEIAELNKQLETRTDYESDGYMELIERVSTLSEKFYSIEEINYDADIEKTLLGLGFKREDFDRQTSEFSGGWRMRIELAKLLLKKPDVLLLDEPTNHMDLAGKEALEKMLTSYEGTVLFVSHDRYFINQVATGILEFGESDVQFYGMNYAQYLEEIKRQTPGRETGNAGGVVRKPADVPTLDDVFDKKKYYNPGKILSRLKRQLEKYEEQLAESESRMSELQLEMMDPELSANYEQLMELQTKIDEENQVQESLLERMMETELELEEMETSESAFVRRQERY